MTQLFAGVHDKGSTVGHVIAVSTRTAMDRFFQRLAIAAGFLVLFLDAGGSRTQEGIF